jgi:hypothetical protein
MLPKSLRRQQLQLSLDLILWRVATRLYPQLVPISYRVTWLESPTETILRPSGETETENETG